MYYFFIIHRDRVVSDRGRTRSLSSVPGGVPTLSIPALLSRAAGGASGAHVAAGSSGAGAGGSGDTEGSSPEDFVVEGPLTSLGIGRVFTTNSLPAHLWSFNGKYLNCYSIIY